MVDGFDTTIPLILQLIVGMFCIPTVGAATSVRCTPQLDGPLLWVRNVLSGLVRQVERWQPENRLLETFRHVSAPMRARPCVAISQSYCGCCQRGDLMPLAALPQHREPTVV